MALNKILCIDDDEFSLHILREILEENYDVITAKEGKSGIKMAALEKPNLILLDISMPEMDGFEVIQKLKTDKQTKKIPVVFVSNLNDEFNEEAGFKLGSIDYIIKPVRPRVLTARIENLLKHFSNSVEEKKNNFKETFLEKAQVDGLTQSLYYLLTEKQLVLKDNLRVSLVAKELGIRPHHLQELLNRHLNTSFPQLIKKIRIETAIELMKENPNEKIINIVYDSGFQSKSVFNQSFLEITGLSPSEYRNQHIMKNN
ncbi:MAG: response regulator [Spirochaetia bacterium]|nr:response regulator [Spirochaetia bacterium]